MKFLTEPAEPVGYGVEVVQQPLPVKRVFLQGHTRTPGKGNIFVQISQNSGIQETVLCRTQPWKFPSSLRWATLQQQDITVQHSSTVV